MDEHIRDDVDDDQTSDSTLDDELLQQSVRAIEQKVEQPPVAMRRQRVVLAESGRTTSSLLVRVEVAEQTSWGKVLTNDLISRQLRMGVLFLAVVLLLLGALPVVFHVSPEVVEFRIIGLPLPWLLLVIVPFPLLFGVGLWCNRWAEYYERNFVDTIKNDLPEQEPRAVRNGPCS